MKISFNKYPADIILCLLWSLILLPIVLLDEEGILSSILGLPFILFVPGYILIFALFPARKTDRGIGVVERIGLSFGLSIAVVPLIGLGLNYTPWGIRLEPILLSLFIFVMGIGALSLYRWFKTDSDERFTISLNLSLPKSESKLDKALTIILAISVILAISIITYVIITPQQGEQFTQFYLLGSTGNATGYPRNLTMGENATVIMGIVNHEYKTVNYTIEVWLINQSIYYDESGNINKTIVHHMWFLDKITTTLEHTDIDLEKPWTPQWEYNYTFTMDRNGSSKLAFLLYTTPSDNYSYDKDYKDAAEYKINSAYRETHLWINVV